MGSSSDLGHVRGCGDVPLAQSCSNRRFCAQTWIPGPHVIRRACRTSVVFGPAPTAEPTEIGTSGRISTGTDDDCACHIRKTDTTTLSPECQQPSHQSVRNPVNPVAGDLPKPLHLLHHNASRDIADHPKEILFRDTRPAPLSHLDSTPPVRQLKYAGGTTRLRGLLTLC